MRRLRTLAFATTLTTLVLAPLAPAVPTPSAAAATDDLTTLVNPFVGTQNFGNTFPGASAPFGMVQVSPDTGGQGGYDYSRDHIYGFSQTHLSGVGCEVLGELPVMPTTGPVTTVDHNRYASRFSHDDEEAQPGYYRVRLSDYDIESELTATTRTGWQRHTFPATEQANVLFNTGKAQQRVFDSEIHVLDDHTLAGRVHAGNFCAGQDRHAVYFVAEFDRPFTSFGTWRGNSLRPGEPDAAGEGSNGAWVTFDTREDSDVVVKITLSYTGIEGARLNLAEETGGSFDFDATREALNDEWNRMLHAIEIDGGTRDRQVAFYTALYHSLLHPNVVGDVDGRYRGADGTVRQADGFTPYANFSLWDTYRPQNQLVAMLAPQVARDSYLSVLAIARDGGWLPRWSLVNSETNIMTGDPVTPFLVEGWSKGLLHGYEEEAYEMLRRNALEQPPAGLPFNGRTGIDYYNERGYIPYGLRVGTDCRHMGGDNDCVHPASATQEYAVADAALALMAQGLGRDEDAQEFTRRAQSYRTLWDGSIGQFRPRTMDGTWLTPYEPSVAGFAFHEGGAYQYRWLVPQDPAGLVRLMGGRAATERQLDEFFAYEQLLDDPAGTARSAWVRGPFEYYGKTTYNPNNEPDLLAPYMYLWTGTPDKTATVVRAAMTLFTTGPDGMTGNDDLGTMSAWYVFSSLGLYPTMSGANFFALTSPQFEQATIRIGEYGNLQGGTLSVTAPGVSDERRYITAASVNTAPWTRTWIDWQEIRDGGSLAFEVDDSPGTWGTLSGAEPPSVQRPVADNRRDLAASLAPEQLVLPTSTEDQDGQLEVAVLAHSPGSTPVDIRVDAPSGWQASPESDHLVIESNGLPVQRTVPVTLTVPAGVESGSYSVTVTVSASDARTVTRTASVEVRPAATCGATADGQCAVDLDNDLNHDGTATVANSDQGNFDGAGWSYDGDLLPPVGPVAWDGVTYLAPDPAGTAPNFVEARGQAVLLPAGEYGILRLVAAAHHGTQQTTVTVQYADGSSTELPVTVGDWAGSPPAGSTVALDMPHRIRAGQGIDGPPVRLFGHSLPLDSTKVIRSLALPNNDRVEIYAVTLMPGPLQVCNIHCDQRDPTLAEGDRMAGTATVWGREIALHISDPDNMAWASIDNGDSGDEVWLDRSFDGGQSWEPDGSKLGYTAIPAAQRGSRTMMYNVDNPADRGIGAVRACGKAGDRPEISCTPWARSTVNAATPADAAATALMQFYDNRRGLWNTTGWWNSANALIALTDHSERTGSTAYRYAIETTFENNLDNDFTNEYVDDTGWWGLAWVRAYDLTGEQRYLDMAKIDADYMHSYWDDHCGGGVWWRTDKTYKNAVTNELYITLSAALHNRIPGDTVYLTRAQQGWEWFEASGMINEEYLINDGLDNATCENNGATTWTYNQGIILGGLVELHRATGDPDLLADARRTADAATSNALLNPDGILREPCESGGCGADAPSFKGIFVRGLGDLDLVLPDRPYLAYLNRQADSAYANNRNTLDQYGLHWAGPFDSADAARQQSSLDLMNATL